MNNPDLHIEELKNRAKKCIDILSVLKDDMISSINTSDPMHLKSCMEKVKMWDMGKEVLENVFHIVEHENENDIKKVQK